MPPIQASYIFGSSLHEGVERRVDIGRRHRVDAHAARAPFGGERLGQVMHRRPSRRCRRLCSCGLLTMKPDIEPILTIEPDFAVEHVLAEGAAAPERAVEVDVDDVQPVLVGDRLGRRLAARDAGIVDEDVDLAVALDDVVGDLVDLRRVRSRPSAAISTS